MSYHSIHMEAQVNNMRKATPINGMGVDELQMVAALAKAGNLHVVNPQMYGNSKFDDQNIVVAFFKCKFQLKMAGIMAGYAGQNAGVSIGERLLRINTNNSFRLVMNLIDIGVVTKEELTDCLNADKFANGHGVSQAARVWQHIICRDTLSSLTTLRDPSTPLDNPINAVATTLGITEERVEQCLSLF